MTAHQPAGTRRATSGVAVGRHGTQEYGRKKVIL